MFFHFRGGLQAVFLVAFAVAAQAVVLVFYAQRPGHIQHAAATQIKQMLGDHAAVEAQSSVTEETLCEYSVFSRETTGCAPWPPRCNSSAH